MDERIEIRLSGSGGQGLILAGIILAEAAILEGKNAVQTQSYGPEARGGASKAEIIISNKYIDYPKVNKPDVFLSLTEESTVKYICDLKPDAILIVDSSVDVPETFKGRIYSLPVIKTARDKVGKEVVANIVALGVITAVTGIIDIESVENAILDRVPAGTEELNKKALKAGFELVNMQ